jgi:hypothetical protein
MAYNRKQARALSSDSEYELFAASLGDSITELTAAQLRGKITRARTLRDKNADLFRRQSLAMREETGSKRGRTGAANERTEQKARLFDEALKRFEARLARLNAQAKPAGPRTSAKPAGAEPDTAAARAEGGAAETSAVRKPRAPRASTGKPDGPAPPTAKGPSKARVAKGPAGVSPKVKLRTAVKAAHTRAANARSQAKRDKR